MKANLLKNPNKNHLLKNTKEYQPQNQRVKLLHQANSKKKKIEKILKEKKEKNN